MEGWWQDVCKSLAAVYCPVLRCAELMTSLNWLPPPGAALASATGFADYAWAPLSCPLCRLPADLSPPGRKLEDQVDRKTAELIALRKAAMEYNSKAAVSRVLDTFSL